MTARQTLQKGLKRTGKDISVLDAMKMTGQDLYSLLGVDRETKTLKKRSVNTIVGSNALVNTIKEEQPIVESSETAKINNTVELVKEVTVAIETVNNSYELDAIVKAFIEEEINNSVEILTEEELEIAIKRTEDYRAYREYNLRNGRIPSVTDYIKAITYYLCK